MNVTTTRHPLCHGKGNNHHKSSLYLTHSPTNPPPLTMECRVGLPTDGVVRWRCDICSLLNVYSNDTCKRCQEPMGDERKKRNKILPKKKAPSSTQRVSASTGSSSSSSSSASSSRRSTARNVSKPRDSKKSANMHGFSGKNNGKSSGVTATKRDYKMKKLRKEDLSEKHLGYRSGKKRNINTMVRSKLNHDTAAYRAKHGGKNPNDIKGVIKGMKKGVQYATINDLTRNGFQTTLSTKNKAAGKAANKKNKLIRKLADDRPVSPPPKRKKGQNRSGLIDRLQKAASGDVMANMRAGGRGTKKQQVDMGEGRSMYAM